MGNNIKTIDNNMVAYINRNNTFVVEINGEEVKNESKISYFRCWRNSYGR